MDLAQVLWGLVLGSGLVLLVWLEKLKEKEQETAHYLDLRKDSRLAQERSLQLLHQKEKEKEKEKE
jgi:hypothetical protein